MSEGASTTDAPSATKRSAQALPIPEAAPVTITTFPFTVYAPSLLIVEWVFMSISEARGNRHCVLIATEDLLWVGKKTR